MTNYLSYKTIISIALAGSGLLAIAATPSVANSSYEMTVKNSSYIAHKNNNRSSRFELTNGQQFFQTSPYLVSARTTYNDTRNSNAIYYFTIKVPSDAGEALKAIKIEQRENFTDKIAFKVGESRAFIGDSFNKGESLSLAVIGGEKESIGTVTVVFEQPVSPGNTVTIAVKPRLNPDTGGTYLFGVTAYPQGANTQGLYLGVGRLQIHNP